MDRPDLPYHVYRTPSHELPVYHLTKRGGNLHQTIIRKVSGDRCYLEAALRENLGVAKQHITVNSQTGNILIKVSWWNT